MDKISLKLLKKLYKKELCSDDVNRIIKRKNLTQPDARITMLEKHNMILSRCSGDTSDGEGGHEGGKGTKYYYLTIQGREYIDERRRENLKFWLPYCITTVIALSALAAQVFFGLQSVGCLG